MHLFRHYQECAHYRGNSPHTRPADKMTPDALPPRISTTTSLHGGDDSYLCDKNTAPYLDMHAIDHIQPAPLSGKDIDAAKLALAGKLSVGSFTMSPPQSWVGELHCVIDTVVGSICLYCIQTIIINMS